jgi:hypothetical protein
MGSADHNAHITCVIEGAASAGNDDRRGAAIAKAVDDDVMAMAAKPPPLQQLNHNCNPMNGHLSGSDWLQAPDASQWAWVQIPLASP